MQDAVHNADEAVPPRGSTDEDRESGRHFLIWTDLGAICGWYKTSMGCRAAAGPGTCSPGWTSSRLPTWWSPEPDSSSLWN